MTINKTKYFFTFYMGDMLSEFTREIFVTINKRIFFIFYFGDRCLEFM